MAPAEPLFGIFPTPNAEDRDQILEQVLTAEREGLDLVGIQDHPYQRRFLDTWSLIAFLAARTERIRFFPDVANLPLRQPAVMAKAAATIDLLSGGRFELGLGAGAFWEGVGAMGGPVRSGPESVDALEEAIEVIRLMWSGERSVSFEGRHYRLDGLHPGPLRRTRSASGSAPTGRGWCASSDASRTAGSRASRGCRSTTCHRACVRSTTPRAPPAAIRRPSAGSRT